MKKELIGRKHVVIFIFDELKFDAVVSTKTKSVEYSDVEAFEVVGGSDAEEIERDCDPSAIDEYHEYLVLYFADGTTATFRNSHADLLHI